MRPIWGPDHPRGCGEKGVVEEVVLFFIGSSPRVRGKVDVAQVCDVCLGIIPAGAGKSLLSIEVKTKGWDHPRGCGEKTASIGRSSLSQGSSPRVRGKGHTGVYAMECIGIIPAGAGKSLHGAEHALVEEDHPRGCGEKARAANRRAKP